MSHTSIDQIDFGHIGNAEMRRLLSILDELRDRLKNPDG